MPKACPHWGSGHVTPTEVIVRLSRLGVDPTKYAAAEADFRRNLSDVEAELGPNHLDTLEMVHCIAILMRNSGRHEDAEPLYRRLLEGRAAVLGAQHPSTLESAESLAHVRRLQTTAESEPAGDAATAPSESIGSADSVDNVAGPPSAEEENRSVSTTL